VRRKAKTEEQQIKENVDEFNKITDASAEFLKAIFPPTHRLINKIKNKKQIRKEPIQKPAIKKVDTKSAETPIVQ